MSARRHPAQALCSLNQNYDRDSAVHTSSITLTASGGWVKIQFKLPHFHVSDTCRVSVVVVVIKAFFLPNDISSTPSVLPDSSS